MKATVALVDHIEGENISLIHLNTEFFGHSRAARLTAPGPEDREEISEGDTVHVIHATPNVRIVRASHAEDMLMALEIAREIGRMGVAFYIMSDQDASDSISDIMDFEMSEIVAPLSAFFYGEVLEDLVGAFSDDAESIAKWKESLK